MFKVDVNEIALDVKMNFDEVFKPFFDEIQEGVSFSKSCGEYEDNLDNVNRFINYTLTDEDKLTIIKLIKSNWTMKVKEGGTQELFNDDIIIKSISQFIEIKFDLQTY